MARSDPTASAREGGERFTPLPPDASRARAGFTRGSALGVRSAVQGAPLAARGVLLIAALAAIFVLTGFHVEEKYRNNFLVLDTADMSDFSPPFVVPRAMDKQLDAT